MLLVKDKVVSLYIPQGNHTLHLCRLNLYIEAPLCYSRYGTVVLLAQLILHKLHSLVFDAGPLRLCGKLLTRRRVLAHLLKELLLLAPALIHIARQKPVHHHIGITPDRRGKMGIVVESKTVVSHIICAVLRPCHRAQGKNGDCRILRPSLALLHKSIQLRCNLPWILGRGKFIAEVLNKIAQALYLLLVWSLVDTVNKGWRFGLQRLGYIMGHLSVCKEHKLLYKPVGLLCNLFHHIQRLAVTIYNNLHLRTLK